MFIDETNRKQRQGGSVEKGMLIDAALGRLLVNTGGRENMRCRFPVEAGIKASLQVWWVMEGGEEEEGGDGDRVCSRGDGDGKGEGFC